MAKRPNGTGSILKLKNRNSETGKVTESKFYYIFYSHNGKQVRESTGTDVYKDAEAKLRECMGKLALNPTAPPTQSLKKMKFDELANAYEASARAKHGVALFKRADGSDYVRGVPNLRDFFGGRRLVDINETTIAAYTVMRREAGVADPTIRRELVVLRAMWRRNKVARHCLPDFEMPQDTEAAGRKREGFVNPEVFAQLLAKLPANLHPLVSFLYQTGCRVGAAKQITWDMVNEDATQITLPAEIVKNRKPLTLPIVGNLSATLKKQFRKEGPVFDATNLRKEWATACHALGLGVKKDLCYHGLKLHDLRRSAVRNLVRAGVRETVAMSISGHKTRHVFDYYNITDDADKRDALLKVGQYAKLQTKAGRVAAMPKAK